MPSIIDATGEIASKYRKTHLVTAEPMLEHKHLGSGTELVIGNVAGMKAGFMTCYDVRFPEVARTLTLHGIVAANRIGNDGPGLIFCGASRVIDPYGVTLASASEIEES